jgi:NADH:ubiquinone oxidoreductase subunit 5 (subunit L)/multisubunit Na+/H+ antiporter MnhA subunit
LCGILLIYYYFRTFDFATIFVLAPFFEHITLTFFEYNIASIELICFFLFIGTMGKSAQLGLHTWLPDAMEGPTPVSALIHAATLVTAGVFLVIRSSPLFELSPNMLFFLVLSGGFTSVFSGLVGVTLYDIKKIIAYSTCSQLGYMVYACGLSAYDLSFFHLINHAFFKALLFLSAGAVIHAMSGEQDIRKYGQLHMYLPYTYSMLLIGSLSLIGTPFLSGFYSKDLIIETGYVTYVFSYSFTQ